VDEQYAAAEAGATTSAAGPAGSVVQTAPEGTVEPLGDTWAPGVQAVAVSPRSRRFRWGVAVAVVAIVSLITVGGTFVLSGAAGARSLTASVAPQTTVLFMEVRSDLPGDQRSKLADFMSHFPGFADRSQFDSRWDELLNQLTLRFSPDLGYTSAFKPWMEGEISLGIQDPGVGLATTSGKCPGSSGLPTMSDVSRSAAAEAIVALKDRSKAAAWVSGEVQRLGLAVSTETYAGTTLYIIGGGAGRGAYAITDHDLILGTVAGVKATLDTAAGRALADNATYKAAMAAITGDSLARYYIDVKTLLTRSQAAYRAVMCAMPGVVTASLPPLASGSAPDWLAGSIYTDGGTFVVETKMPRPAGAGTASSHSTRIASSLPASTVAAFEGHAIGTALGAGIGAISSAAPSAGIDQGQLKQLEQVLSMVGGVDWIGDGTVVVTKVGSTYDGGVVLEAPDATTAKARLGNVTGLIGLSGIATGIKSRSEAYNGSTITVVTVPASLAGRKIDIAAAVKDNLVVVGYTDAFVKSVIDTTPATSLASRADYRTAMGAAGSENAASAFVDIPALRPEIASVVDTFHIVHAWALDYKPYLDHLDGLAAAVIDGTTVTIRLVVTAS
jgi:hypothetical protein